MNQYTFIGRLVADPEIRYTEDGKAVARFRLAVNRSYRKDNEAEADFFSCICFGKIAERIERAKVGKGVKLCLGGEVRNNNYTDREGRKHYDIQFVVNSFEFCESRTAAGTPAVSASVPGFEQVADDVYDAGLPFN